MLGGVEQGMNFSLSNAGRSGHRRVWKFRPIALHDW
jgi:hypothetical protein